MADSSRSSKSFRVRDFLPTVRPSYLSVILVFVCGFLLLKNEETNDRLLALENRLTAILPREGPGENGSPKGNQETSHGLLDSKIRVHDIKMMGYPSVKTVPKEPSTSLSPRKRRHVSNNASQIVTMHEVRQEITELFEQLMPTKYCRSSERVCPAGPPGLPGPIGAQGPRGRRGPRGKTGTEGRIGQPGKSGMAGTPGLRGQKGDRGNPGPKGMPGSPGRPGESISVPNVVLSPAQQTRDEGQNSVLFCTVGGNPSPSVEWKFKGRKLLPGAKYSIEEGKLTVANISYSDAGQYTCVATNILGSSEGSGNLVVRGLPVFTRVPSSLVTPKQHSTFQQICQAEGFPPPVVSWTRLVLPLPAGKTVVSHGSLTIRNLSPADSGLYECVATNVMGTKKSRMNLVVQQGTLVTCDCWRSRSKRPQSPSWAYSTGSVQVDAIDFQTSGDVILQGYRLWGVSSGSTSFQVTIGLYRGSSLIAQRTGSYSTRSSTKTFQVHFSEGVSIRAGVGYTATAKITTSKRSFCLRDGMSSTSCSGVTVTFKTSSKDTNASSVTRGQIPALIFRSSQC